MIRENLIKSSSVIFGLLMLTSCSSVGLLSEKNSWLPHEIDGVGDFFGVYVVLQISILLISLLLSIIFGRAGYIISLISHFIWIVSYRDYGFWSVLLLFGLFSIVSFIINLLRAPKRDY